ncbi:hypothetical protein [Marinobacter gelidimuriae]|uniref:hypothetical protein n=1 Tax=Marinobacter gelidimuriae TaxID=2739064 RepID=UPI00036250E6|nr:hypothetical protein [Marinobacter gelidimuriae]
MFLASLRLSLPCLIVAALFWLAIGSSVASAASQLVTEGWEYRWGDSPIDANGVPTWTETSALDQWSAIDFRSNPPDRNGRNNVWYRVTLPAGHWHDPVLYIFSVDLIVQVWQGDRQIYQFGEFDAEGRGTLYSKKISDRGRNVCTIGLLQLEIPEDPSANTTEYGIARLYFSMDQIIQKIGITLSRKADGAGRQGALSSETKWPQPRGGVFQRLRPGQSDHQHRALGVAGYPVRHAA